MFHLDFALAHKSFLIFFFQKSIIGFRKHPGFTPICYSGSYCCFVYLRYNYLSFTNKSARIRVYRFSLRCSSHKRPSVMWCRIAGRMKPRTPPPTPFTSVEVSSSTAENPILTFSDTSIPVTLWRQVSQKRRPQIHHKF